MKFVRKLAISMATVLLCAAADQNSSIFEASAVIPRGKIDRIVFARLKDAGIQPANRCSDAVFIRRIYLDLTGTLPAANEVKSFLADPDSEKRSILVDRLLERDEFADYMAMRWADLLRVKAEFPINLWPNAAQAYHHWIRASIRENKPYDQFARELLTASGSNFRDPAVNFYRAVQNREPKGIAQAVALAFMGVRADKWPAARISEMSAFFSRTGYKTTGEWKEEIVFFDASKPVPRGPMFPDGVRANLPVDRDPREAFAEWLTAPGNAWFASAEANRIWSWLMGRGIVDEPDDFRDDNPPSIPALLDYLRQELIDSHFDQKHLIRLIANSDTYQFSSIPKSRHPDAPRYFASYPLRRLEAEVLADALCQITGTSEDYSSAIPEPYTFIPEGQRSISLPDGSITSSFLELFGRPPRDTGLDSERNNRPSAAQRLHMLNSTHVQRKLRQGPKLQELFQTNVKDPRALVNEIYLAVLSRPASDDEWRTLAAYSQKGPKGREAIIDLTWALINSTEFLYRH